jgi:hypothetical protein
MTTNSVSIRSNRRTTTSTTPTPTTTTSTAKKTSILSTAVATTTKQIMIRNNYNKDKSSVIPPVPGNNKKASSPATRLPQPDDTVVVLLQPSSSLSLSFVQASLKAVRDEIQSNVRLVAKLLVAQEKAYIATAATWATAATPYGKILALMIATHILIGVVIPTDPELSSASHWAATNAFLCTSFARSLRDNRQRKERR